MRSALSGEVPSAKYELIEKDRVIFRTVTVSLMMRWTVENGPCDKQTGESRREIVITLDLRGKDILQPMPTAHDLKLARRCSPHPASQVRDTGTQTHTVQLSSCVYRV